MIMDLNYFKDNILPQLKNIRSFKQKSDFLANNLVRLGAGSGRIVYEINDKYVLKFAKNSKGVAQNEFEAEIGTERYFDNIVTQVIAEDDQYGWIVSERAKKITERRMIELTEIPSLADFNMYLKNNEPVRSRYSFTYKIDDDIKEILNNNEFVNSIVDLMNNYDMGVGDLGRISSYGEVIHDGEPTVVLTDYGLNMAIYNQHYNSKMYELYNVQDGNYDDLNNADTNYVRDGIWALMPQGVGDGDNLVNDQITEYIKNRNYYPNKPIRNLSEVVEYYYECYDNINEYLKKVDNKVLFYENLLKLQEYLSNNNYLYRPKLGELVTEISVVNENGNPQYIFSKKKLNERILSSMKGSSSVSVKDKCKLGGETCNQGDINNFNIKSLNEDIDAIEAYSEKNSLKTVLDGKRNVGLIATKNDQNFVNQIKTSGLNYIKVKQSGPDQGVYIVYNNEGALYANLLHNFMISKGGYVNDETPEETYYIGRLLGYSEDSIQTHIDRLYGDGIYSDESYKNYIDNGRKSHSIKENLLNKSKKNDTFVNPKINEVSDMQLSELPFRNEIESAGGKIYSVGGIVRDKFLNKESKDLDIIITGIPMDQIETILSKYGTVNSVGKSFGIIKFKINGAGEDIDIAIPRKDRPTGQGGHKGFDITSDHTLPIEDDLYRRDFTINSMASDVNNNIIDPYNGQEDIKNKLIRVVNPEAFSDDPLRMLRAINFGSRFGFKIEPKTMEMIQKNAARISEIPAERILTEFDKIVHKGDSRIGAQLLKDTGIFKEIFGFDLKQSTIDRSPFEDVNSVGEFIFLLIRGMENPGEFYLNRFSSEDAKRDKTYKEINALSIVYDYYNNAKSAAYIRSLIHNMYLVNPESINSKILPEDFYPIINQFKENEYPLTFSGLAVDGNDLLLLGLKGKEIGDALKNVTLKIYSDKLSNNKNDIINFIQNNRINEGVADKYAEREFGFDDEFSQFNQDEKTKEIKETPVGIVKTNRGYKVPIYKNPKNLNRFDKNIRALSDINGNIYVALYDKDNVHDQMGVALGLLSGDVTYFAGNNVDDFKFLAWYRIEFTDSFGLSIDHYDVIKGGTDDEKNKLNYLIQQVKNRNPQFEFKNQIRYKLNEGVADKYAAKEFGFSDEFSKFNDIEQAKDINEKPYVVANAYGDVKVPIYLNPKNLNNFDSNTRAICDANGNLYVALSPKNLMHDHIGIALGLGKDDVYYSSILGPDYMEYLTLIRLNDTNKFALSSSMNYVVEDGTDEELEKLNDIISRVKQKNPQFDIISDNRFNLDEGVGDKYFNKIMGGINNNSDDQYIDNTNNAIAKITSDNGKLLSFVCLNPINLNGFDSYSRAIADINGNLYVAKTDGDFIHDDIAYTLYRNGIIPDKDIYSDDVYLKKYMLLYRQGTSNVFQVAGYYSDYETAEVNKSAAIIINKVRKNNPQYKFVDREQRELYEGVADKYMEKEFGIPDEVDILDKKYDELINDKPVASIYAYLYMRGHLNIGIFKNPKILNNFGSDVRAISDSNGDLYVAQYNASITHGVIGNALFNRGLISDKNIYYWGNVDESVKYLTLRRSGKSNVFNVSDSMYERYTDQQKKELEILFTKVKNKNPQYEYINDIGERDIVYENNENKIEKNVLYSAVVLDENSRNLLIEKLGSSIPDGWDMIAHHMTINLGPINGDLKQDVGKNVELIANKYAIDHKVFAVMVSGYPTMNKTPHITIAVNRNNGGKPKMSNQLTNWHDLSEDIILNGTVTEISKNKLDEGVADKYAQREFGIPDTIDKLNKSNIDTYGLAVANAVSDVNGKLISIPIYKNPKSLNAFDAYVRAIGTIEGDLFVGKTNKITNHRQMCTALYDNMMLKNDEIYYYEDENPNEMDKITLIRVNNDKFTLADSALDLVSNEWTERINLILANIKQKNPQFRFENQYAETKFIVESEENDNNRFTGCLMAFCDINNWDNITSIIKKDDVYDKPGFGVETEPHVTVLYGLDNRETNCDDVFKVISNNSNLSPIKLATNEISVFENELFDVVKFDVNSDRMVELNKLITSEFPFKSDFPDYHPHMTIAYVKKGCGKKYAKKFEKTYTFYSNKLVYSTDESGDENKYQLKLSKDELNEGVNDLSDIVNSVNKSKKIPKELKEKIIKLINSNSEYIMGGFVKELTKPKELQDKCKEVDGVSLGADKNGFFVYTHRARSKSFESPEKISIKSIKFIETTG